MVVAKIWGSDSIGMEETPHEFNIQNVLKSPHFLKTLLLIKDWINQELKICLKAIPTKTYFPCFKFS
jgi:hypothetical protein